MLIPNVLLRAQARMMMPDRIRLTLGSTGVNAWEGPASVQTMSERTVAPKLDLGAGGLYYVQTFLLFLPLDAPPSSVPGLAIWDMGTILDSPNGSLVGRYVYVEAAPLDTFAPYARYWVRASGTN